MDIFGVLTMLGGLALFLFGMNVMGTGLEKVSGGTLERTLEKMTDNRVKALGLGLAVTAGSRTRKFRNHEALPVRRHYHGSKYRYHRHGLAAEPYRYTKRQCINTAS